MISISEPLLLPDYYKHPKENNNKKININIIDYRLIIKKKHIRDSKPDLGDINNIIELNWETHK